MQKFCLNIALLAFVGGRIIDAVGYNYQQPFYGPIGLANFDVRPQFTYGVPTQGFFPAPLPESNVDPIMALGNGFASQPNFGVPQALPETLQTGWNKEFYSFEAPVEHYEDTQGLQKISSALQKNLRVVFIKTPENHGLEQAALALAKQTTEDRTAIFVLNKQNDLSDLANRLNTFREHQSHKPEVHFVKYKTAEEAAQAQQYIRAQFDSVQGVTTQNSNEGVASVLNFATTQYNPVGQSSTNNYYAPNNNFNGVNKGLTGSLDEHKSNNYKSVDYPTSSGLLSSQTGLGYNYNGNAVDFGYSNGFGDGYAKIKRATSSQPSFKANERHSNGAKFVFPSDDDVSLPPL